LFFQNLIFSSLCVLDINLLSDKHLGKILSHSVSCLFILVIVSFDVQKLFNLMQFHMSILACFMDG
jgi:hypothetical protein